MKPRTNEFIENFFGRNPHLVPMKQEILKAAGMLLETYRGGGKVLICGNGGSAADSEHIVGELMKGFLLQRPVPPEDRKKMEACCGKELADQICSHMQGALPAISLVSHTALQTAFCNDVDPQMAFAQQVYGYKKEGDTLIGLSTSGNSANVFYAVSVARAFGMKTIAMTGIRNSRLSAAADVTLRSPETETYRIQEDHLKIYHLLCAVTELELFEK